MCVCVWVCVEVGSSSWRSRSDAGELVPEAGWQDVLYLLHDEVQRSEQRAEELQDKHQRLLLACAGTAWLYLPLYFGNGHRGAEVGLGCSVGGV